MTFDEYGKQAITTIAPSHSYGDLTPELMAQILGLMSEGAELGEKVKKLIRDQQGMVTGEVREELLKELGDVLWYVNSVAQLLDSSIAEVANINLQKVLSRKARGVISGSGDNR